jgi:hypothetical protein
MANEGTIRIHRSIAGTGAAFRVSFVPYDADDQNSAGIRAFHEVQQVRAFLKTLGLAQDLIADALRQLAAGRSASLPNVSIAESVVRSAGLTAAATAGSRR